MPVDCVPGDLCFPCWKQQHYVFAGFGSFFLSLSFSPVLAEDAIKAALADYKLKQGSNTSGPEKNAASM